MTDNTEALPPLPDSQIDELWHKYGGVDLPGWIHSFGQACARAALAQRQQAPTTAWLVEWRFNGVQWLYLWPSAPGGFSFTSDASKALRFARRQDAEAALQWARDTDAARRPIGSLTRHGLALGEMLVTEHDWPALTAAPSAQAEPVKRGCDTCQTALMHHSKLACNGCGPEFKNWRIRWALAPTQAAAPAPTAAPSAQ